MLDGTYGGGSSLDKRFRKIKLLLGDQLLHEIREARRAKNVEMSTLYIERRPANDPATSR